MTTTKPETEPGTPGAVHPSDDVSVSGMDARPRVGLEAGQAFVPGGGEHVISVAQGSLMADIANGPPEPGTVVISDQRIVHLGATTTELPVRALDRPVVTGDLVLIDTGGGGGVLVDTPDPAGLASEINELREPDRA